MTWRRARARRYPKDQLGSRSRNGARCSACPAAARSSAMRAMSGGRRSTSSTQRNSRSRSGTAEPARNSVSGSPSKRERHCRSSSSRGHRYIRVKAECSGGLAESRFVGIRSRGSNTCPTQSRARLLNALMFEAIKDTLHEIADDRLRVDTWHHLRRAGPEPHLGIAIGPLVSRYFKDRPIEFETNIRNRVAAAIANQGKFAVTGAEQAPPIMRQTLRDRVERDREMVDAAAPSMCIETF